MRIERLTVTLDFKKGGCSTLSSLPFIIFDMYLLSKV